MDFEFTRGDTKFVSFELKDGLGNKINLTEGDKIYFTVKQSSSSKKVLIQKTYPEDIQYRPEEDLFIFFLSEDDTALLGYGTYQFDIEVKSGDFVVTLGLGTITLTDEITHKGDEKN